MKNHGIEMFGAEKEIRAKALEMVAHFSSYPERDGIDGWWEMEWRDERVCFSFNLLYENFVWSVRAYNNIDGTVIYATECLVCEVTFEHTAFV